MRFVLAFCCAFPAVAVAQTPKLRLDDSARPVLYSADLTLRPETPAFSGTIDIDLELRRPTKLIWLNATDLTIRQATTGTQTAAVQAGDANFVGLNFPNQLPAGRSKLHIQYDGKISPRNTAGIFQSREDGEAYLFTQFESTDARRAFPCFDQPDIKTPWQLTLHIPKDEKAVSNTSPVSEADEAGGMKRVVFAPTKPLPSYLVAFAVGPFDIVDAGRAGVNHIPVRIITPKGKGYQARYAAEVTATIIDRLENYFGVPFPFEKSDQVTIPMTVGFSAMENAGMVTYTQTSILADPALDTIQRQRRYASVAAHELAHQWFGDLVTLAWWNDTWLNEAFATWTSSKILAEWKPEWNSPLGDLGNKYGAMARDSLASTRRIRQPIESMDDISNAFDGITYQKGAAVIRMFESWVGEKQFQQGVKSYLERYKYKAAAANDFLDTISSVGQPKLTSAFSTFLEQSGFPEVSVDLQCTGAPRLVLGQKRYRPIGSGAPAGQTWQVPVCVRYATAQGPQSECFLLDKASTEVRLTKATGCPANLSANNGATGYYVTRYSSGLLHKLLAEGTEFLSAPERRTLLHDLQALADGGDARESEALQVAASFAKAPERLVAEEAESVVARAGRLAPDNLRPNYARFVRQFFGPQATRLGWTAKPGDDAETRLLRSSLAPFVAVEGEDAALQGEARRLADGWLRDRTGVDADMVRPALTTAAKAGGRDFFDGLVRELNKTRDLQERGHLFAALRAFRDPSLVRASLDLMLRSGLDPKETSGNLFTGPDDSGIPRLRFDFVKANYDALLARMPSGGGSDGGARLSLVGQGLCDESSRREYANFFEDRARKSTGGPRNYALTLEGIQVCEARQAAQQQDVAAFFK